MQKEYQPTIQPHIFEKSMWQPLPKFQNHPNLHPQIFRNSMWQPTEKIEKPMWYLVGIFEKSICGRPPEFCVFRSPSFSLLYHKTEQNAIGENEKKIKIFTHFVILFLYYIYIYRIKDKKIKITLALFVRMAYN